MSVSTVTVQRTAWAAGAALIGYSPVMERWQRQMKATGGPGIVAFELAAGTDVASRILATWGPGGRRAARRQIWADFGYMQTYAVLGLSLAELARRGAEASGRTAPGGSVVRWLPVVAMGCDAVEGVGMLSCLARAERGEALRPGTVRLTRAAAATKFSLLAVAVTWAAAVRFGRRPGPR